MSSSACSCESGRERRPKIGFGFPDVVGGSQDYHLIDVTNEDIQGRAKELVKRLHADKIRELDEQIASISWP